MVPESADAPLRTTLRLVRETYAAWNRRDGWLYAAAMAAFAALALAPLFVITLRVSEIIGGRAAAVHALAIVITPVAGHGAVRSLEGVATTTQQNGSTIATVLSVLIAVFAGSRLFYAMQRALHRIWRTPVQNAASVTVTILSIIAAGAIAVFTIGALTLIVFGSAVLAAVLHGAGAQGAVAAVGVRLGAAALGAVVFAPLVAALFKWLPGTALSWGDVWVGALVTTAGFVLAQAVIAVYLVRMNLPWTYGSAASLIVVLLWLYYSSYLFLLGAQFTEVFSREVGSRRAAHRR
jgi:membrane protein